MKRGSTGNEAKRSSEADLSSSQRMAAAGSQAIEAHARVRWLAERLGEELTDAAASRDVPSQDLDPEDPMVVAVEKAATTMKSVTASMAAVTSETKAPTTPVSSFPAVSPVNKSSAKTKLGVGANRAMETDEDEG